MIYEIGKTKVNTESADGGLNLFVNDKNVAFFNAGNYLVNTYSTSKGKILGVVITTSEKHIGKYYYYVSEDSYGFRRAKLSLCEIIGVLKKDYKSFMEKLK